MIPVVAALLSSIVCQTPVVQAGPQQVDALYAAVVTPRAIVLHYRSGGRRAIPGTANTSAVAFAADNRGVYYTSDTSLWWVALDGTGRRIMTAGWKMIDGLAVSPDGKRLAFCGYTAAAGWGIYTLEGRSANAQFIARGRLPAWLPDSRGLLFENYTDESAQIYRFDPETRAVERMPYDRDGTITTAVEVAVAPGGRYIAFSTDGGLRLKELETGYVKMLTTGEHIDNRPVFSADAKEILFMRQDRDPVGRRINPRILRIDVRSGRTELLHGTPAMDAAYPHPLSAPDRQDAVGPPPPAPTPPPAPVKSKLTPIKKSR